MNRVTTTMIICALVLGYQPVNASPPQDAASVTVHFADLNLPHSEDIVVLYRRLKGAAESVCATQNGGDIGRHMLFKACWQTALSKAVAKVDQPALTAYYRANFSDRNATLQIAQK